MGGGLPAAAFGGRADLMDQLAPIGPVYQAGTLSGNPVAVAAGLDHAAALHRRGLRALRRGRRRAARRGQRGAVRRRRAAPRAAGRQHVLDLLRARRAPGARLRRRPHPGRRAYTAFFHAMLARGVYLPPSAFEAWFVNAALVRRGARPRARRRCPPPRGRARPRRACEPARERAERRRRPPAAARRGLQPRQGPLRPAARLPAVRRRRGAWPRRPRRGSPAATSPTWCPARWSARSRPPRRSPRRCRCRSTIDERLIEAGNAFEGMQGRRRRRRAARARATGGSCATRSARRGASPTSRSPPGCSAAVEAARDAARGHEAVCVSHQLPIWTLRLHLEGRRYVHDPRRRAVRAGQRHLGDLRRRPDGRHRLRRAGRRHRPRRGARGMRRLAPRCCAAAAAARRLLAPVPGAVDVNNGGEFRFVAGTPAGEVIPAGRARRPHRSSPARCSTAASSPRPSSPARSPCSTSGGPGARPAGWRPRSSSRSTPTSRDRGRAVPRART